MQAGTNESASVTWWMAGTIVAVAAAVAIAVWWWVPKWQVYNLRGTIPDAKDRAKAENDFRTTLGQFIGGAAVLLTASLAYYQTQLTLSVTVQEADRSRRATSDQTQQTLHETQLAREASERQSANSVDAARALALSQQVAKGFEDLGSKETMVVIGGLYALAGAMEDQDTAYHLPILEGLCAFVLERTRDRKSSSNAGKATYQRLPSDVLVALTVIGRRPDDVADVADLSDTDFGGGSLIGADLSRMIFLRTIFASTNLYGAKLNYSVLTSANLSDADLDSVDLSHAVVDYANFAGASLQDTKLFSTDMSKAENLTQTQLEKACGDRDTKVPAPLTIRICPGL